VREGGLFSVDVIQTAVLCEETKSNTLRKGLVSDTKDEPKMTHTLKADEGTLTNALRTGGTWRALGGRMIRGALPMDERTRREGLAVEVGTERGMSMRGLIGLDGCVKDIDGGFAVKGAGGGGGGVGTGAGGGGADDRVERGDVDWGTGERDGGRAYVDGWE
jgi:hypothetical protein